MGNKTLFIPVIFAVALFGAAFLFNAAPAAAAERDSLARGITDMVTQRLCDRQAALGGRVTLIHPSKCTNTPPPALPTVTLTASPTTISSGQSTTLTWTSANATSCTAFVGWTGAKPINGSASVSPTVTTTYQLDCMGPGGVGSDDATVTVTVVNPTTPTVDITANPATISAGSSTTLTWNSDNATSCTASNGWSGAKAVDGTQGVSPTVTTTYAISCTGAGGTVEDSVTVTVNSSEQDDPTLDLTANPATISQGSSSLLSWSTTNATTCQKSGGWSGATTTSGTFSVSPTATTTYSMECTGPGGSVTDSVTVSVSAVPLQTITQIVVGDARFDTLEAAVIAAELADDLGSAGPFTVFAPTDDAFAALPDGVLTALLAAPTTTLKNILLYHVVSGAFDSGEVAAADMLTTLFDGKMLDVTMTAEGLRVNNVLITIADIQASNGIIHVINAVLIPPTETPQPTVNLVAAPGSVTPGSGTATTTLTWTTANANTCTASGGTFTGSKAVNGSEIITPSATTTYMLECIGSGGTTTDSVSVNFVPTPVVPGPTVNHLLISEVHYNPDTAHGVTGSPDNNEWVEIYNPTGSSVTMNNWWIGDTTTSIDRIPNGTTIPAGGYLVISQSSTTPTFWPSTTAAFVSLEATIGGGLANTNDAVFIFDASGATTTVDSVSWGTNVLAFNPGASTVGDGQSLARSVLTTDTDTATDWSTLSSPSFGF